MARTLPERIEIQLDIGSGPYTVDADPTRIQQMLTNLAVNARDAMATGGTLRIGLARLSLHGEEPPLPEMPPGDWIALTVADTGSGFTPEALTHLFEPFFTTKAPG